MLWPWPRRPPWIGTGFSPDLLRRVVGAESRFSDSPRPLDAAVGKLIAGGLVSERSADPRGTYLFKHALVRDAAYQSLPDDARRTLHRCVARALAEAPTGGTMMLSEVLAHHWTEAGETAPALDAWLEAGTQAAMRGAFAESVNLLKHGLTLLSALPASPERDAREFQLLVVLGNALVVAQGYGSTAAAAIYERIRALGERSADPTQLHLLLLGQWIVNFARQGPLAAQPLADQAQDLAERASMPRLVAAGMRGATLYQMGDLAAARETLSAVLATHAEDAVMGVDVRVLVLAYASHTAWHLGRADEARALAAEMVRRAQHLGVAADRAFAEHYAAALGVYLCDPESTLTHARRALAACAESPNQVNEGVAALYIGWALAQLGEVEEGVAVARDGLDRFLASGQRVGLAAFVGWMADAYAAAGQWDRALSVLAGADEALPGDEVDLADALRRRADLLHHTAADATAVEVLYRNALDVARTHGDRAYELRAAVAYGRWLRTRARAAEARDILAPIYAAFTEGFDTRDLVDGRQLLRELTAEAMPPAAAGEGT